MQLPSYVLQSTSTVKVEINSEPIDVGEFTASQTGSLDVSFTVPNNVDPGFHTLHIYGKTYSGEDIDYYQDIEVRGSSDDDIDDDGVLDNVDQCVYIQPSNTDSDLDGVDDACDPEINDTPQLYRVREGSPSRTYNGAPELSNYLYIERNAHAKNLTGVAGDYDPDGDGWSIVGMSQGIPYTTTSVPDTAPAANFLVTGTGVNSKPYVYIRAGGYGCTSFTPTSLAKVQQDQVRTLKKVSYNTDKCRQEPLEYDVDGNGQPDNTQPLYEAHQGNAAAGEDESRIYLYRNFYASESQLGISDYSPTGTSAGNPAQPIQDWNLLAASKPNEYIPSFNKLVTIEDSSGAPSPIVLTKKQNGQCIAYRPNNTDIIKQTTQNTRYFTKLTQLPQGLACD